MRQLAGTSRGVWVNGVVNEFKPQMAVIDLDAFTRESSLPDLGCLYGSKSLKLAEINTMPALIGRLRNHFTLVAICLFSFGCSGCQSGWGMQEYRAAVRSGRSLIAPALEMEKQFPDTEHMLIMYGSTGSKHEWQTVSFFGGRYVLTMSVDVFLNSNGTSILRVDDNPRFSMSVYRSIEAKGDSAAVDQSRGNEFSIDKWLEFKESGFDIKVLDPAYDGSVLPYFKEYANTWQENRRVWR